MSPLFPFFFVSMDLLFLLSYIFFCFSSDFSMIGAISFSGMEGFHQASGGLHFEIVPLGII